MLFFALCLRMERLTQLHYERVGWGPAAHLPAHRPRPGSLGRDLARLCTCWGVSVIFWIGERAKGTPISWLLSGVFMGLLILGATVVGYLVERKRQRARPRAARGRSESLPLRLTSRP